MSLPSSMADFVLRDRLLQKAYWPFARSGHLLVSKLHGGTSKTMHLPLFWSPTAHSDISLDENLHSCKNQWSCWKKNLKGLKDKVCDSLITNNIDSHSIEWAVCNATSSPGIPFVMRWKSGPLARSNDIPVLNGFVNTIDWDQNQSDLSDLTLGMRRVTGSPWIAFFWCWNWPEVAIPVADQKDRGLWEREFL